MDKYIIALIILGVIFITALFLSGNCWIDLDYCQVKTCYVPPFCTLGTWVTESAFALIILLIALRYADKRTEVRP
jgi:hypothetical protein